MALVPAVVVLAAAGLGGTAGHAAPGHTGAAAAANAWKITNAVPYSKWVQGNDTQTWRAKYGNWRTISDIASTNIRGAIRFASQNLARLLKGQG